MRILSLLILFAGFIFSNQKTNSPHGSDFKISCKTCHSSKGWQLDKEIYFFNHNNTKLPLVGQHVSLDCRQCHKTLIFKEAKSECFACHDDVHQTTVGVDCSRCHSPKSWLVNNISDIHQRSRFPLVGAHRSADCIQCHKSESMARFDVPGINCIDCHRESYLATTNPNHIQAGYPQDCLFCHPITSFQWTGSGFNHSVFPLDQGHSTAKCTDCHKTANYTDAKTDCYSCHQQDYMATKAPDHNTSKFSTACQDCHTLNPGWKPAAFPHTTFPLTQGHAIPTCNDCHKGSYTAISTDCYSCHQPSYAATTNPNHISAGIPTTCATCHTTVQGWKPATYTQHDAQLFPIYSGRHKGQWTLCTDCHTNAANYTLFDCKHCHTSAHRNSNYTNAQCYTCHPKGSSG